MSLKEQIDNDFKQAMISKDELGLSVSRLLKSAIKNAEIDKGAELDDEAVVAVVEKQAKQRRDSIDQFDKAGRTDLSEKEKAELVIIEKYLPEKMSEEEIRTVVSGVVADNAGQDGSAGSPQDFGRVMGMAMGQLKGKADGALVQKIVRELMES
jgi:uncharacterized protein YqeY